jgi:hypothetical protein
LPLFFGLRPHSAGGTVQTLDYRVNTGLVCHVPAQNQQLGQYSVTFSLYAV